MQIALVSKAKAAKALFGDLEPTILPPDSGEAAITKGAKGKLVYFDRAAYSKADWLSLRASLRRSRKIRWAVIDLSGEVADPAALFHSGALDYVGPTGFPGCIDAPRIAAVEGYALRIESARKLEAEAASARSEEGHSGALQALPPWQELVENREYDFLFVLMVLSDGEGIRRKYGELKYKKVKEAALGVAAGIAVESGGRLWMGDGQTALLLFPHSAMGQVLVAAARVLANRLLVGTETLGVDTELDFRFAFHYGRAPWRKPGKTGTVIADAVNFVHHLGRKNTPDGMMDASGEAFELVPEAMAAQFKDAPSFEGKKVHRFHGFAINA